MSSSLLGPRTLCGWVDCAMKNCSTSASKSARCPRVRDELRTSTCEPYQPADPSAFQAPCAQPLEPTDPSAFQAPCAQPFEPAHDAAIHD